MVVLGLLLLALAGIVTAFLATTLTDPTSTTSVLGISLEGLTLGGLFVAGVVTGVLGMLGLSLVLRGLARNRRRRVERKRAVQERSRTAAELEAENDRLAQQLEDERTRSTGLPEHRAGGTPVTPYPDASGQERSGMFSKGRSER